MSAPQLSVATRFLPPTASPVAPPPFQGAPRTIYEWGSESTAVQLPPLPYAPAQQVKMRQLQAEVEDLWQSLQGQSLQGQLLQEQSLQNLTPLSPPLNRDY